MGQIEWAMWANEQAVLSSLVLLLGGIIGVAGLFNKWEFAAYSIVASLIVLLLEYPRGKRKKGNTIERKFQHLLTPIVNAGGFLTRNYYVRFVLHLILCIPCCFVLPTVLGGVCLIITSIVYFVAAFKGEEWVPIGINKRPSSRNAGNMAQPPSNPPPRAPPKANGDDNRF